MFLIFIFIFVVASVFSIVYPNYVSQIFTLAFSGVIAIATLSYVFLTGRLVSETEKTREIQTDPWIVVEVRPRYEAPIEKDVKRIAQVAALLAKNGTIDATKPRIELYLVFRNTGLGPAFRITPRIAAQEEVEIAELEEPNPINRNYLIRQMNVLSERLSNAISSADSIDYIAPNEEESFYFWNKAIGYELEVISHYLRRWVVKIKLEYYKSDPEEDQKAKKRANSVYIKFFRVVDEIQNMISATRDI
jgi:hypothetical protein